MKKRTAEEEGANQTDTMRCGVKRIEVNKKIIIESTTLVAVVCCKMWH